METSSFSLADSQADQVFTAEGCLIITRLTISSGSGGNAIIGRDTESGANTDAATTSKVSGTLGIADRGTVTALV
jgi:hypothetical protein